MPLSDAAANTSLDDMFNAGTGFAIAADPWLQLHSGDPGVNGTTNVVSVGRVQFACPAAAARTLSNTANVDFVSMPAVASPGVVAWSVWDSQGSGLPPTGGICFWTGWFSNQNYTIQVDDEDLATDDLESPTHGLLADDRVVFEVIEAFSIPAGLTAGTLYFVLSAGNVDDMFRVSTTSVGAAVNITAEGQALARKVVGKVTNSGDTFRINAGDLDLFL